MACGPKVRAVASGACGFGTELRSLYVSGQAPPLRASMRIKPAVFASSIVMATAAQFVFMAPTLSQQQRQAAERLVQYPVRGTRGAVAAGSSYSTEAGMRMYY